MAGLGRDVLRIAAVAVSCAGLGACGVSQLTSPFKGGLFGGGEEKTAAAAAPAEQGVSQPNLVAAAQNGQSDANLTTGSLGCPSFDVANGGRSVTFYAPGGQGDALSVMHRGDITNTARECGQTASGLAIKYGFSGRVLLGPKGKAGTLTLPAKVTVVDGSKQTLKTEKVRVVVNVPAGSTNGYFSEVREIVVPIAPGGRYRVYVGFDQSAVGGR